MCYAKLEDYEKAIENYLVAYEMDSEDSLTLTGLGRVYDAMEKYEDGLQFLLKAEKIGRDDEWLNTEIGVNLGRSGKTEEGIERLQKSLTMIEDDDTEQKIFVNSEIGWLLYGRLEEPNPEEAIKYLKVAKELGRDDEWLNSELGFELGYNQDTRKEALEHFERAIELGRNDAWVYEMRGTLLLDLGKYEEALESFRKAYSLNKDGWYLYSIGRCLRRLERYEEAIENLLESRQISLDEEDVVDGEDLELAFCYIGVGDKEKAEEYLKSARESIEEQGTLNDYIQEEINEIEKGILSLTRLS